ncbi:hypothetical protein [Pyxidicoccus xibeiensis]|uniref:hypothetical protein n=1 Tax=Pyxidicoccus xibeiensis TaxID=2906759 RepID=UPI0020A7EB6A|nr:hypothetical protein [Pyxidicoccus xibeiensis]MCP3139159.1 hypothetical protein [Pyxidicoccus xibeiensis]
MRIRVLKSKPRSARGQALVLACLSFLVLALMTTLSFNLSHALRQKVSLQQHSDSLAYSMAVMEARALNYYAVSNRAIAASYVAMNSLHAYMAVASVTGQIMRASRNNFYIIAAMEFAQCACWTCFIHCIHGIQAIRVASKYGNAGRDYDGKAKNLENSFNQANKGLDMLVETVHASQMAVHARTVQSVMNGNANGLSELTNYNAPGASNVPGGVGALNTNEFNCAIDGMVCMGGQGNSSNEALARVMTEVSNASRPGWTANRDFDLPKPLYLHPSFLQEMMMDIPGEGLHYPIPFVHKGTAKLVETRSNIHGPGQVGGNTGKVIAADEEGAMFNQWKHGVGPYMPFNSRIHSDTNGGGHTPNGAHSDEHEFDGVNTQSFMSCIGQGNCFMKFRADPDANDDYGQPSVYSYVTRQFRVGNPNQAPWELNANSELNFTHGGQGTARLTLAAGEGSGLSKALVYYHRFGSNGWREAPNMFNPYWRAKLHPFRATEAATVLGAAGNTDAAQLAVTPGVSL